MDYVPHHVVLSTGSAERTALVLHGILASHRNWRSLSRRLAERWPGWRFVLVDLRGHGESPPPPAPWTVSECAADLARLVEQEWGQAEAVIGHSFGGKVALVYGRDHGLRQGLDAVWVLDSPPGTSSGGGDVERVIDVIAGIEMPVESRNQVVDAVLGSGLSRDLAAWMTTNLRREGGGFVWRFDLDVVQALLRDYRDEDLWPWIEGREDGSRLHLVRAARSDRWSGAELGRLQRVAQRPDTRVHVLEHAGHWLHVDAPEALIALLGETLGAPHDR